MADIIKFPFKEPEEPMDHELDIARECMKAVVTTLIDYQYYPNLDEGLEKDLGLVYHILYATMLRYDGQYHQFHEMMDEIMNELENQRNATD